MASTCPCQVRSVGVSKYTMVCSVRLSQRAALRSSVPRRKPVHRETQRLLSRHSSQDCSQLSLTRSILASRLRSASSCSKLQAMREKISSGAQPQTVREKASGTKRVALARVGPSEVLIRQDEAAAKPHIAMTAHTRATGARRRATGAQSRRTLGDLPQAGSPTRTPARSEGGAQPRRTPFPGVPGAGK
jgi:hypothetical protein